MNKPLALFTAAMSVVFILRSAAADTPTYAGTGLEITNAMAEAAPKGGRSAIRFRAINDGSSNIVVIGITSAIAASARIVARLSDEETTTAESVVIRRESELDLHTSHMWIELVDLKEALVPGQSIEIRLEFSNGSILVPVHVHAHSMR